MSQTPEKLQLSALKFKQVEKVQKTTTQMRVLQTDRKSKQNIRSPLMLILLLKKKVKSRIEQAFLKISLCKNKNNRLRLVANYISSILKFKLKMNSAQSFLKLKNNSKQSKNISKLFTALNIWVKNKIKLNKIAGFNKLKNKSALQHNKQSHQPLANLFEPKTTSATKRTDPMNKSIDSGSKSMSASKLTSYRGNIQEKESDLGEMQKIRKENEALKIMQLSEEAREALKKVQRFDRVMYAQQTQKVCRDVLTAELKRLQKIKNSQKQMRSQYYDNQLTITALHNHIKLIHEINKDLGDASKFKEAFEKQQARKRQQQFKLNLQNKRRGKSINLQTQIKNLIESVQANLCKKDYEKAKQQINILITKYEKQQLLKDKITFYKALLDTIVSGKEIQKCFEDINKLTNIFKNYDFTQIQNTIKLVKQSQREFTLQINKYSKQEKDFEKQTHAIIQSLQYINNALIVVLQPFVQKINKNSQDQAKLIQKQLQKSKLELDRLASTKNEYDQINRTKKQFEKKVLNILQKAEAKVDYKRDFELLHKDKQFIQQKPYSQFFKLQKIIEANHELLTQKQIQNIITFINQINNIYSKDKVKPEIRARDLSKFIQNSLKKNANLTQLSNAINNLVAAVLKNQQQRQQQQVTAKRVKTDFISNEKQQTPQQKRKSKLTSSLQTESAKEFKVSKSSLSRQKNQVIKSQDRTKMQQLQKQLVIYKEATKNLQNAQKKINDLIVKIQNNQDWITEIEAMKKDRTNLPNKNLQLIFNFYSKISDPLKKINSLSAKTQNFLNLIQRVLQRKNLVGERKFSQIQKILDQSVKTQPFFAGLFTKLVQHLRQMLNLGELSKQQSEPTNQKQSLSKDKIKQLTTENKNLIASIESEKNRSNSLSLKIKQLQKASRQITQKITSLQKQKKEATKKPPLPIKSQEAASQQNIIAYKNKIAQLIQKIQLQIQSKQFLSNGQSIKKIESGLQFNDKIQNSIVKIIARLGAIIKSKLEEERKQSAKTIKSYENELQKMNTLISQFEIKIKEKDLQYQQLLSTVTQSQKATSRQPFKSPSLKASRKSIRSNSSQKQSDMKNIKASIEAFAEDERNLLQKLNHSENEKVYLIQKIKTLELQIFENQNSIEQLHNKIQNLQQKSNVENEIFERQYQSWREKELQTGKSLQELNIEIQRQLTRKQQELTQKLNALLTQRQFIFEEQQNKFVRELSQKKSQIVNLRQDLNKKIAELQNKDKLSRSQNSNLEAQSAALKARINQYQIKMVSAEQVSFQLQAVIKQNGKLQADISYLAGKNKQLQEQVESSKKAIEAWRQQKQKQKQSNSKLEQKASNLDSGRESSRIQQLQQMMGKLRSQQQKIINHEINLALKHQEDDFNRFLVKHDEQIEQHFFTIVIPQKIKEFQIQVHKNYAQQPNLTIQNNKSLITQKQLNEEILKLRNTNKNLKQQYQQQYRVSVENENKLNDQLRATEDLQRKFDQQIKRSKNYIAQLQKNSKNYLQVEQNIRKYLHSLQISYQEACSGFVSENILKLYANRGQQKIVEVIKQKIVSDPRQEANINELSLKIDQQWRMIKDLESKLNTEQNEKLQLLHQSRATSTNSAFNVSEYKMLEQSMKRVQQNLDQLNKKYVNEANSNRILEAQLHEKKTIEDSLRHDIRRIQSAWQSKLYEQNMNYERKIMQITNQRNVQNMQLKSLQEFKHLETKIQEISIKYNNELKVKLQLQNKCKQLICILDTKIGETQAQSLAQMAQLNNELIAQKQRNYNLSNKLSQKQKQIKLVEDGLRRQIKESQALWVKRMEEKNNYYERRISDLLSEISNSKASYKVELNNFNHIQCEKKYFNFEQTSNKQIYELKTKLNGVNEMLKKSNEENGMLKQVINNQQSELKQFEAVANGYKKSKEQIQKQKQSSCNDFNAKLMQKQRELFKIKSDYESKISLLTLQKQVLSSKLNQTLQSTRHYMPPQKIVDNNYLKVIELQSLLTNKLSQIKRLQQLNEKRKHDFETEYSKLLNAERERQSLRNSCHILQTQVLRLQQEVNHLNNQMRMYKQLLSQSQNRQQILRNDLIKLKSEGEQQSHIYFHENNISEKNFKDGIVKNKLASNYQNEDLINLKRIINSRQNQKTSQNFANNQVEIQTLMRINEEVTELVSTNRQLQTKCALLESQIEMGDNFADKINFFIEVHDKIQLLMNFLVDRSMVSNVQAYNAFLQNSNEYLHSQNVNEYFNNLLIFLKSLFLNVSESKSEQLKQKAEQLLELKEQMNNILDKHLQFAEDSNYETLDKYKMIFSDIKILLKQYINTKNEEYIQMIWRSLNTEGI